jgi:hypothetical protein
MASSMKYYCFILDASTKGMCTQSFLPYGIKFLLIRALANRHVPAILLAIWHKVPAILLAIWHKVPCNVFIVFLKQSDASEQGEAYLLGMMHASRLQRRYFPAKIAARRPVE